MRRVSEEERKLFKTVIEQARPVKKSAPTKPISTKAANTGGLDGGTQTRLRRGTLEPQARLDLHGYSEEAAHGALLSFLRQSRRRGDRLVLVVTGKGAKPAPDAPFDLSAPRRGVLKSAVPRWLNESSFAALVASSSPAHRRHGGAGALYIYLRKNR